MAKLHQILAAERGATTEFNRLLSVAATGLGVQGEQSPLSGLERRYEPVDPEHGDQLPSVSQRVQIRVERDVVPLIKDAFTRLMDLKYARDEGNTHARADVTIGGRVLLANVPATYLLTLENSLSELRTSLTALPVLDPAQNWAWDPNRNVYAADETVKARSVPTRDKLVLFEPTEHQPGQAQVYEVPNVVGKWHETKLSGCMPAEAKEEMLRRLAELQTAVKFAREEANRIDAPAPKAGEPVFDFLVDGTLPSTASTTSSSS